MNSSQLCGFCQSPLKTFTRKPTSPTDYTVCENMKKNQCPFFTKTSLLQDYCSVLLYRVKQIYKDLPRSCEHDKTAMLFLSRTKANFNRPFFKCASKLDHDPCSYFQWKETTPIKVTFLTLPNACISSERCGRSQRTRKARETTHHHRHHCLARRP